MSEFNAFFSDFPGFYIYLAVVAISAVLMLVNAFLGIGSRTANGIIGGLAAAYAIYLIYIWIAGGSFIISFWAFIIPILAVYELVKGIKARNAAVDAARFPTQAPPAA